MPISGGGGFVAYVGPGDIVPGAQGWWGLRAYRNGTVGVQTVRLRRDSDNHEQDFYTLASGALDVSAITTFKGAANLFVVTLYDQVGGNPLRQLTAGVQPPFSMNILNGLPAIDTRTTQGQMAGFNTFGVAIAQPLTYSMVINYTSGTFAVCATTGANTQFSTDVTAANISIGDGSLVTVPLSVTTWHALQGIVNGASTNACIDGTSNTGAGGATGLSAAESFFILADAGQNNKGKYLGMEWGLWTSTAFSAAQLAAMNANQHQFWRF